MYLFDFIVYPFGVGVEAGESASSGIALIWPLVSRLLGPLQQEMVKGVPPWKAGLLRPTCWLTPDDPTFCWQKWSGWRRSKSYDLCLCELYSPFEETRGSTICLWLRSSRYQLLTMLEAISNKQDRGVSAFMEIVLRWITSFYSSCLPKSLRLLPKITFF